MATILGTDDDNLLNGTAAADAIYAQGGNDAAADYAGDDTVYGSAGNDDLGETYGTCFRMNAFCGSVNLDSLIGSDPPQPGTRRRKR